MAFFGRGAYGCKRQETGKDLPLFSLAIFITLIFKGFL
jgi:hypothetical protein